MTCIGISGAGGVGKTTTAKALCAASNRMVRFHIADPLKAMMTAFYATTTDLTAQEIEARVDGPLKRLPCMFLGGRTPTEAQQTLGTEWGRDLVSNRLWLDAWERRADDAIARGLVPINESVRFENEAMAVRQRGGVLVRLTGRGDLSDGHASERSASFWVDLEIVVDDEPPVIAERILRHVREAL